MGISTRLVGLAVTLVVGGVVQEGFAQEKPTLVGIRLSQRVDVPGWALRQAQNIVSSVYARAGVEIVWADGPDRSAPIELAVIVTAHAPATSLKSRDVLAVAIAPTQGSGRIAYAMWPRVQAFAFAEGVSPASVLGRVIAHEVGHLLLGQRTHSNHGIMKAHWNKRDFASIGDRAAFTPEQSIMLRQRIAEETR